MTLQEIKTFHDTLPGPSATATAKAKDLLTAEAVAERTPRTGSLSTASCSGRPRSAWRQSLPQSLS